MPVSIVHQTSADNKGSCSKYGHYLNKENKELKKEGNGNRQQFFFNHDQNMITTVQAITMVDDNNKNKGLAKKQDKYFTLTLNFSQSEQEHLASTLAKRPIENVDELNSKEYENYNEVIKLFARQAMRNYAANFKKDIDEKQIVWFAKIEHKRRYKGTDKEVLAGRSKSGELKKGLQTHVHITVSRMHKDYRINLSPLANARSSENLVLNGRKVRGGFDRSSWKQLNEDSFDKMFQYKRGLEEKFETLRKLKHGTLEEKRVLKAEIRLEQNMQPVPEKKPKLISQQFYFIPDQNRITKAQTISTIESHSGNKEISKGQVRPFELTLNLSQREQEHLTSAIAERPVENIEELTALELKHYNEALQVFAREAMRNFAASRKRRIHEKQLEWFSKIEHDSESNGTDEKSSIGKSKTEEPKKRIQTKINITVSGMQKGHSIENRPILNVDLGLKAMLNEKPALEDFDYSKWKQLNQNSFDTLFGFERSLGEKQEVHQKLEHGTLEEKSPIKEELKSNKLRNRLHQKTRQSKKGAKKGKNRNKGKNNQISL
ncbi:DUF5712 family protein [Maribacter halichondriae]|uniref:DUF5712 family protein n=1 Tax=Maribacter halichondriae TaxID=2980554 RepID=UPI00235A470F|nr:DUF5712 family protein [Maribacter sp. Hal144]